MSEQTSTQWYWMKSGMIGDSQEGPVTDRQLMELARQGKVKPETQISSPQKTKGQWIPASRIAALVKAYDDARQEEENQRAIIAEQKQQAKATQVAARQEEKVQRNSQINQSRDWARQISDDDRVDLVLEIANQLQTILVKDEVIEYIAIQKKLVAVTVKPDAVVVTNRRIIIYKSKILGRFDFTDCLWLNISDCHLSQQMMTSTISFTNSDGHHAQMENLHKTAAARLYQIAQQREEEMIEFRRKRYMEEQAAGASQINVVNAGTPQAPQSIPSQPAILDASAKPAASLEERLLKLKSLSEAGLITSDEFEKRKAEILSEL